MGKLDISEFSNKMRGEIYMRNHHPDLCKFLDDKYGNIDFREKLYLYQNNLEEPGRCIICGKYTHFINGKDGYRKYCCSECSNSDPEKIEKQKNTTLIHYGVSNPSQNKYIKNKKIKTCRSHYKNGYKSEEIKNHRRNTCLERYGDPEYRNKEKQSNTCLERYGSVSPFGSGNVIKKSKQTKQERYGDPEYRNYEKSKQTKQERYGDPEYRNYEKSKQTKQERYGDPNWNNREQVRLTKQERYGDPNWNNREQVRLTKQERYGDPNWNNREQSKRTCLKKYGVDCPTKIDWVKDKIVKTCNLRYGVDYVIQSDIAKRNITNNSKSNIEFEKLLQNNDIEYRREYPLINRVYDFKVNNLLIEINPFPTHNSTWGVFNCNPKDKNYHRNKSKLAFENGFRCIHVWDWDNPIKVVNIIKKSKESINYDNCVVHICNSEECRNFCDLYSFKGNINGSINVCLKYNGEITHLMSFVKLKNNKYEWLLNDLCGSMDKKGYSILLDYFKRTYNPSSILIRIDNSKFDKLLCNSLGLQLKRITQPTKHWWNGKIHIIDSKKINRESMIRNKFVEIYDSGQSIYGWIKKENS